MRPATLVIAAGVLACGELLAPAAPEREEAAAPRGEPPAPRVTGLPDSSALERLRTARYFTTAAVGYAGSPSPYVAAWRTVLARPDADSAFRELYATGTTVEARLYALVGLYVTDRTAMEQRVHDPSWRGVQVRTAFGCMVGPIPADSLLPQVVKGEWAAEFRKARV